MFGPCVGLYAGGFLPGLIVVVRKADIGLNNLMHIKRDFCVKIVMKNVRKLRIKAYKNVMTFLEGVRLCILGR